MPTSRAKPLSPHISIYKPQISSVLSILHRMTGMFLFLGVIVMVWWVVDHTYVAFRPALPIWDIFHCCVGAILLFGWSFCLFYHLLNGIRHLFWDIGMGFELKTMCLTGMLVVIGAFALTALSVAAVYFEWHRLF
jgi:succinate dehydrogenase / fumarate reductase cytochrome b subunit